MVTGYELPTRHIIGANGHICCVNWAAPCTARTGQQLTQGATGR
jgi:hypothetical protein